MKLGKLVEALEGAILTGDPAVEAARVEYDSRRVGPGAIFAAVRGLVEDGRQFVDMAVQAGAAAIMTDSELDTDPGVPVVTVTEIRAGMTTAAAELLGRPAEQMTLIGLTGTNGKTTTTYLLESILTAAGHKAGVVGTVDVRLGDRSRPAVRTTPEGPDLQQYLAEMLAEGADHVVMEVASHALDLHRVAGCRFDVGVFTNLTQDHLDYHGTFDNYYQAKRKLFTRYLTGRRLPGGPRALINVDDAWGRKLVAELSGPALTFALENPADFQVRDVRADRSGLGGTIVNPRETFEFRCALLGDVNLYNILAAAGAAYILGVPSEAVSRGLAQARQTPGRLERVGSNDDYLVLVDYAHTPDALTRVLTVARNLEPRRLVSVFGCGGDRDKTKRPIMGEAAGRISDLAILSSDNPRTEDPLAIIEDVLGGMSGLGLTRLDPDRVDREYDPGSYIVEPDRRKAIRLACRLLRPGDVLVIAGKGHEDYQILGREKVHFDDREEAAAALRGEGKL